MVTLEASPYRVRLARTIHTELELENVSYVTGLFSDTLAPTLAELAGAEPPIDRDGRSLVRTLDGTERDPPETFHFESFAGPRFSFAGIREARWKFSEYAITGERELYDLLEDPHELENLASDPDQAARVQAFRERILERRPGWPNDLD